MNKNVVLPLYFYVSESMLLYYIENSDIARGLYSFLALSRSLLAASLQQHQGSHMSARLIYSQTCNY